MFSSYQPKNSFDEYFIDNVNSAREILIPLLSSLDNMGLEELIRNHSAAKKLLLRHGATFRLKDTGLKGSIPAIVSITVGSSGIKEALGIILCNFSL